MGRGRGPFPLARLPRLDRGGDRKLEVAIYDLKLGGAALHIGDRHQERRAHQAFSNSFLAMKISFITPSPASARRWASTCRSWPRAWAATPASAGPSARR